MKTFGEVTGIGVEPATVEAARHTSKRKRTHALLRYAKYEWM